MKLRPSNEAREQADLQLHRTLMIMLVGVFVVVLLWISLLLPPPRFEPIVHLPYASSGQKAPERECQRIVTIRADGRVFIGHQPVALSSDLERALRQYLRGRCELQLRIDKSVRFGTVRQAFQAARTAGVPRVTVLVRPHESVTLK